MPTAPLSAETAERYTALEAETRRELEQTREQLPIDQLIHQSASEAISWPNARRRSPAGARHGDQPELQPRRCQDPYTTAHEVNLRLFDAQPGRATQLRQEQVRERQNPSRQALSLLSI
jgi:hypothetical protein